MPGKLLLIVLGLAALPAIPAAAQNAPPPVGDRIVPAPRYARAPIEIHPGRLLYRRCAGWYELQYRLSGTVLYPSRHCWCVRG